MTSSDFCNSASLQGRQRPQGFAETPEGSVSHRGGESRSGLESRWLLNRRGCKLALFKAGVTGAGEQKYMVF